MVLSPTEVARLLAAMPTPAYRMLFCTMYASGLRIGEACRLVVSDLDSDRGAIRVLGKGQKERLAALHPPLLAELRACWHTYRPIAPWLFTGKYGLPLDPDQARKVFKAAVLATGLGKRATPHSLRHTYATLLLEHGTGLPVIQALLGHGALSSTKRYLHVATHLIRGSVDPMELLPPP